MQEMILLDSKIGESEALVACAVCGRICSKILSKPYDGKKEVQIFRATPCPICKTMYEWCNDEDAAEWEPIKNKYLENPDKFYSGLERNRLRKAIGRPIPVQTENVEADDWEQLFPDAVLEKGKKLFEEGKVSSFSFNDASSADGLSKTVISATVDGTPVKINVQGSVLNAMYCDCGYANCGSPCRHMSALLYAADNDGETPEFTSNGGKSVLELAMNSDEDDFKAVESIIGQNAGEDAFSAIENSFMPQSEDDAFTAIEKSFTQQLDKDDAFSSIEKTFFSSEATASEADDYFSDILNPASPSKPVTASKKKVAVKVKIKAKA